MKLYDEEGKEYEVAEEILSGDLPGPKPLRDHATKLKTDLEAEKAARATEQAELASYKRRDAFEAAVKTAEVEGLTLEDLGDTPADQITPTLLKVKATEKDAAKRLTIATQAKTLGMTPEQYEEAVKEVAAKNAADEQARAAQAAIAAGGQAPPAAAPTPNQKGYETWKEAKEKGTPDDYAQAAFVRGVAEATTSP